jgi:Fur family transcriptional regulator, stress-responsive regulator
MPTPDVTERLREAGLRVTAPRVSVLSVLEASEDHPRVDQVIERVRADGVHISIQAAYDVCEALHRAGLARRIDPAGGPARYEARVGDNHHHAVCRVCGAVTDVDCDVGGAPCLVPSRTAGHVIDEAEVIYWGLCPSCIADPTAPEESEHAS